MKLNDFMIWICLTAIVGACSSEAPSLPKEPDSLLGCVPIGFGAASGKIMENSRAEANFVDDQKFEEAGKFIVYSNYDYNLVNGSYTETVPEFQEQLVTYDATAGKWDYSPKKYWSGNGAYHFRACFPHTADIVSSSNGKNLAVNYSIYKDNYDLMVAYHYRNMTTEQGDKTRPVNLIFNHALAAIRLKMKADAGKTYQLKNLYISNLYTVGIFSYNLQDDSDEALSDKDWSKKLFSNWIPSYWDISNNIYAYNGTDADKITDDTAVRTYMSNYLYAIPQEIDSAKDTSTELHFTIKVDGQEVTTVKKLPSQVWYPGKKYTYLITVKPGVTTKIEVVTTDWDAVDATSDDIIINQ